MVLVVVLLGLGGSTRIAVDLCTDEAGPLSCTGVRLGIPPEELAKVALADALSQDKEDFHKAAECVLKDNQALYQWLA